MTSKRTHQKSTFTDVFRFAAGYWRKQPKKLTVILTLILTSALCETYLPSALSNFLAAIRGQESSGTILNCLKIFIGIYLAQALLSSLATFVYNTFETKIFKSLIDDAFSHLQRLPENFFINTFAGSIISKINRARQQIEIFEDQILVRIFPTIVILLGSIFFLAMHFPVLAGL